MALVKLPWTYTAAAEVMLLPSKNLAQTYGGNPFLAFNSTINETADVIRYEATDMRTAQVLAAAGYTQGYTITDAVDTSAPILLITATGSDAGAVEHTLTGVVNKTIHPAGKPAVQLQPGQPDSRHGDRIRSAGEPGNKQKGAATACRIRRRAALHGRGTSSGGRRGGAPTDSRVSRQRAARQPSMRNVMPAAIGKYNASKVP